jgi:rod shape-determining protein MreB
MPANLAESPLTCVAVGSGRSLEEFETIARSGSDGARRTRAKRLAQRVRT